MKSIDRIRLEGSPPPWGITAIGGFVESVLSRAERGGGELPREFHASFCHWGERNAAFHGLANIADIFEPLYRLVHFTSCGKPFLVAFFTGPDASERQQKVMQHLPWSEHYQCRKEQDHLVLTFLAESQDVDNATAGPLGERSLRSLFESGEILDF